jgi:putative FmdB family regulatory protein
MPMYEYECVMCNIRYEVEQPITSISAPMCCGTHMRQVYHAPGISFKGKGWGKDA